MTKLLGTLLSLLLSAGLAHGGICTGLANGAACLLSDSQTVGTCFNSSCTRTFTVPAGEARTGTGTIDVAADGTVTGTGTLFTQELHPGDLIQCAGSSYPYSVFMIVSDTTVASVAACAAGGGSCPTCTGAAFTYRNPIQSYLDENGNVKGLIDGLGRFALGNPVAIGTYTSLHPDLGTTSSGDGANEDPLLLFSASGGQATSATGATGGRGADITLGAGGGGAATGTGSTQGGAGGVYIYSAGNGGDDTGSGNAGDAGDYSIDSGAGGNANSGHGGKGGSLKFTAHNGGASTSGTGGDGGDIELTAGAGGSGGVHGVPGHVYLAGTPVKINSVLTGPLDTSVNAATQGADITDTNIANTSATGNYRVSVYLNDDAAAGGAGAVTAHIKFNDGSAAQDVTVGPVMLTTLGAMGQATIFIHNSTSAITYGTTHTGIFSTATYHLSVVAEQVSN